MTHHGKTYDYCDGGCGRKTCWNDFKAVNDKGELGNKYEEDCKLYCEKCFELLN